MMHQLYEAQANDAYWHGLFGGLYLPHLRRAVYNAIVALEGMLDAVDPRPEKESADLDLDGQDEIFIHNAELQAVVRMDGSAAICEFDAYRLKHNFGDTLTRQTEHYHRKVHAESSHEHSGEGIANPHERVSFKHVINAADLSVDNHPKAMFIDKWNNDRHNDALLPLCYEPVAGRKPSVAFKAEVDGVTIGKKIALKDNALSVEYDFATGAYGWFSVEINLAMPSCDGPAGRFRLGDDVIGGFGQPQHIESLAELWLDDEVLGGSVQLSCNRNAVLDSWPHFSVSQSEAGFEKIMQAVTIVLAWDLAKVKGPLKISLSIN